MSFRQDTKIMNQQSTHPFEIILFYKYVRIEDPEQFMQEQKQLQNRLDLKGRTLIASEGINATLEGTKEHIAEYLQVFLGDPRFATTHIKRSLGTGNAFPKASVKVRPEIVTLGLGKCDIDPNKLTGVHLSPTELHSWIHGSKEFYIVDMRNAYEHQVGHFQNSIVPPLDNFRDLPKFLKSIAHLKNKAVVTVCTGGVRCEKASGYLLENGFTNVYQLDGGIVSYMAAYPNEDFVGKLYVFDNRMMMGFYTDDPKHQVVGRCVSCGEPCEHFSNCKHCYRQLIVCEGCEGASTASGVCRTECKINTRRNTPTLTQRLRKALKIKRATYAKNLYALYGRTVKRASVRIAKTLSPS